MIFRKKAITLISLIICVIVSTLCFNFEEDILETETKASLKPQIILDAGHGGFDGGAVAAST